MADSGAKPVRSRMNSAARSVLLVCAGVVLIAISASWGYAIAYTLVGPKMQGEVSAVFCHAEQDRRGSHTVCSGTFRGTDGTVFFGVSVKGERPTDVRRGQLVKAVGPRAATAYVGGVARHQRRDAVLDLLFFAVGISIMSKGLGVYRDRHGPTSVEEKPVAGEGRESDVPVS